MATLITWNEKLRRAREENGLSQVDLAKKLGTTQVTISRWEEGKIKPGPNYRKRLCEELGKTMEELGFLEKIDEAPHEGEGEKIKVKQTPSIANYV